MAGRAFANRPVFAPLQRALHMATAAELMKGRFRCLMQIGPRAAVAVVAVAGTGLVDEIVVAGDAVDASMLFVRKKCLQRGRPQRRLQQAQSADGSGQ